MKKTVLLVAIICFVGFGMMPGGASSHREAPLISQDPAADNTDVYMWRDQHDSARVNIVANYIPFESPNGGPNFYKFADDAIYEIHIDNNADAVEDVTFQFDFNTIVGNPATFLYNTGQVTSVDDADLNVKQVYSVNRINGPRRTGQSILLTGRLLTAPANVGPTSMPDYGGNAFAGSVVHLPAANMTVFAGPRDDPFFVDLGVFDLLGLKGLGDSVAGYNTHTIALQVTIASLTRDNTLPAASNPAAVLGAWATASRPATTTRGPNGDTASGQFVQVSRLGMPLVNEVVIPLADKDNFNRSEPVNDAAFGKYVDNPELPGLLKAIFGIDVPAAPRTDLAAVFLFGVPGLNHVVGGRGSEMLRLNVGIPATPVGAENRLGVLGGDLAGFPNGRRLMDDVVDIEFRALAGVLQAAFNKAPNNALGDGVDANDVPFLSGFPYSDHPQPGNTP